MTTTKTHAWLRVMTLIIGIAVILSMTYIYALLYPAQAQALTFVSDVISTSAPSTAASHTISFTVAAGSAGLASDDAAAIVIEFDNEGPDNFDLTGMVIGDIDISVNGQADELIAADCSSGTDEWGAVWAIGTPDTLTLTNCTFNAAVVATDTFVIQIGLNASGGATDIVNPTVGDYPISVTLDDDGTLGAGEIDQGETRVMILNQVAVTARVNTNLNCVATTHAEDVGSVLGVTTDTSGPDCGFTNDGTLTDTALDFDFVCPNAGNTLDREFIGQSLTVTTNAINGFIWTVEQDQNLLSATGADIDVFIDGAATVNPTDWAQPTGTLAATETGWGHYGIVSDDSDLETNTGATAADDYDDSDTNDGNCADGGPCFVGNIATARNIFASDGPADGTTVNTGQADWGIAIEISALQEAAEDYNNTLTHICTPTF